MREKIFEAKNVVLLLPPVTLLHCTPPPTSKPGKLHFNYKMHRHFPPKFGAKSVFYSLKNMVTYEL